MTLHILKARGRVAGTGGNGRVTGGIEKLTRDLDRHLATAAVGISRRKAQGTKSALQVAADSHVAVDLCAGLLGRAQAASLFVNFRNRSGTGK